MARAAKVFTAPTTTQEQLDDLVTDGLIQDKVYSELKFPGEHRVPSLQPGEIVLFVPHIQSGLCLPASNFLHHFLNYFSLLLNHIPPMLSFTFLSLFISVRLLLGCLPL